MKNLKKKLAALGIGSVLSLGGLELTLRLIPEANLDPFANNPVIAAQADDKVFMPDEELGFRLNPYFRKVHEDSTNPNELYFIGTDTKKLQTIDEIVSSLDNKKITVLNMGDSSTSGWDSDVVTKNKKLRSKTKRGEDYDPLCPFFNYRTYSDLMSEEDISVINAGTPAYTSLIGKRYLKRLLSEFNQRDVRIDYVTIYFGNNDSACCGNHQDKYRFPNSGFHLETRHLFETTFLKRFRNITRVSAKDYEKNINEMIDLTEKHGAIPIIIRPVIPKYWHPGLRATGEGSKVWKALQENPRSKTTRDLKKSIQLYNESVNLISKGNEDKVNRLFLEAQNHDFMIPRIKPEYVDALYKVAKSSEVPLVDIQKKIPTDDRKYFIDYCHPIEPANELIAQDVLRIIKE